MRRNIVPSHFTLNSTPNQEHKAFLSANTRTEEKKTKNRAQLHVSESKWPVFRFEMQQCVHKTS